MTGNVLYMYFKCFFSVDAANFQSHLACQLSICRTDSGMFKFEEHCAKQITSSLASNLKYTQH